MAKSGLSTVKVGKLGHSLTVTLPSDFVKANGIKIKDSMKVSWKESRVVYEKVTKEEINGAFGEQ